MLSIEISTFYNVSPDSSSYHDDTRCYSPYSFVKNTWKNGAMIIDTAEMISAIMEIIIGILRMRFSIFIL